MASKISSQRQIRGAERREELLDGLEAVFFKEGFRAVKVEELAARLSCSRRSLYKLAASKQELFLLVVERWLRRIEEHAAAAGGEPDPALRLKQYLAAAVSESRPASQAFSEDLGSLRAATKLLEEYQQSRAAGLQKILEYGVERGRFRPVRARLVAQVIHQALSSLREPQFLQRADASMSEAFEELGELLRAGLTQDRGPSP